MGNCLTEKAHSTGGQEPKSVKRENLISKERQGARELKQNYWIDNNTPVLGTGAFGKVFKTYNKHNKDHWVAIKVMNKDKLAEHIDAIEAEVEILTKLDHPNIVKYYETYIDEKFIYLVMEYIGGGELFDKIANTDN
jgi:calcium-dependent protein kinase